MTWRNKWPVILALALSAAWLILMLTWEPPGGLAGFLLVGGMPYLLGVAALLGTLRSDRGRSRQDPGAGLVVVTRSGRAVLRAVPGPVLGWFCAGFVFLLAAQIRSLADEFQVAPPAGEEVVEYLFDAFSVVLTLLWALMVAALLRAVLTDRPRVDLTPEGIEVFRRLGSYRLPWAALAPGAGWTPPLGQILTLPVVRPDLVTRRGPLWPYRPPLLNPTLLSVDPGYLWRVLHFYAEHPGERADLGTEAGYRRLRAALD